MGAWNAKIFGDDVALDIRAAFLDRLASGEDVEQATRLISEEFGEQLADSDDGPVGWLALAAAQWEYGCLQADTKARALAIIEDQHALSRWTGAERTKREKELATLAKKLLSRQPAKKRPRRRRVIEVPRHALPGPDGLAVATASEIGACGQVMVEMIVGGHRGGTGVFAAPGVGHQHIGLMWLGADTLQITYPATATPDKKEDTAFFFGRTIRCIYCAR